MAQKTTPTGLQNFNKPPKRGRPKKQPTKIKSVEVFNITKKISARTRIDAVVKLTKAPSFDQPLTAMVAQQNFMKEATEIGRSIKRMNLTSVGVSSRAEDFERARFATEGKMADLNELVAYVMRTIQDVIDNGDVEAAEAVRSELVDALMS